MFFDQLLCYVIENVELSGRRLISPLTEMRGRVTPR